MYIYIYIYVVVPNSCISKRPCFANKKYFRESFADSSPSRKSSFQNKGRIYNMRVRSSGWKVATCQYESSTQNALLGALRGKSQLFSTKAVHKNISAASAGRSELLGPDVARNAHRGFSLCVKTRLFRKCWELGLRTPWPTVLKLVSRNLHRRSFVWPQTLLRLFGNKI